MADLLNWQTTPLTGATMTNGDAQYVQSSQTGHALDSCQNRSHDLVKVWQCQ